MFDFLRKRLEEAVAQINPFDGGQTAATVRANRNKPAPAQTVSNRSQSGQSQGFSSGVSSFNTPAAPKIKAPIKLETAPLPPAPKALPQPTNTGLVKIAGEGGTPQIAAPQQQQVNKTPQPIPQVNVAEGTPDQKQPAGPSYADAAKFFAGGTAKALNTTAGGVAIAGTKLSDKLSDIVFSGEQREKSRKRNAENIKQINDSLLKPGSGLFGAGGAMTADEIENTSPVEALKKGAASGAEVASEIYGPAKGSALAMRGGKLLPKVVEGGVSGAMAGAVGSAGHQFLEDGSINPTQVVQDAAISGALGGGIPAAGRMASKLVNPAREVVKPRPTTRLVPQEPVETPSTTRPTYSPDAIENRNISQVARGDQRIVEPTGTDQRGIAPRPAERPSIDGMPTQAGLRDLPERTSLTNDMSEQKSIKPAETLESRGISSLDSSIPEATPIRQMLDESPVRQAVREAREQGIAITDPSVGRRIGELTNERQPRIGEQFAKPKDSFKMTKGRLDQEQGGTILSESKGGTQRKRMMVNPDNGVNEVVVETRNPDGSWTRSSEREPAFEHANDYPGIAAVENNEQVNQAAAQAMKDGKEIHLFADKGSGDPRALGTTVHEFDPEKHIIDGGFVRDANTNQILGNHIKIDDTGMQMNVGKKIVNMDDITGDPAKWKNINKSTYTMDRILQAASPDDATYRSVRSFVIDHKQKAEANMRVDLKQYRDTVKEAQDILMALRPSRTSKKEYMADIFHYAERKLAQEKGLADGKKLTQEGILEAKYGPETTDAIKAFDEWSHREYDSLLDRTNEVLRRFGHEEVQKRQNYMTHLQEDSLWDKIGIGEDLYRDLTAGIQGEMNAHNRGALPGNIAGLTADFQPTKKYNPFHQTRRGKDSMTDPFKAMDAYGEAAMFNIHMTESAVRARSLESVFRAAEEVTNKDMLRTVNEDLRKSLKESLGGSRGDLVNAFQEYANTLAGKSNHIDRAAQDKFGAAGRTVLRLSRALQKIAAQSSIAGNFSVTIAQALNLPNNIGTNGIKNVTKGIGRLIKETSLSGEPKLGTPASQSNFLKVRYTDAQSKVNRSIYQKTNDVVSKATLMPAVERAFVEMAWNSSYETALKKFSGKEAVREADRLTERLVAGRGLADQPDLYRSTLGKGMLQYTLEVNSALKNVTKDMSPLGLAKYAAAVFAMNYLVNNVTGRAPLPDFVGAGVDTVKDFADSSDKDADGKPDENIGDKLKKTGQRFAAEAVKTNPVASSATNLLSQDAKDSLFGPDSDISRYDGAPAGAAVISKVIQAFDSLLKGDMGGAADTGLSVVPFGGQIRKTTQGVGAMNDGYAKNGAGDVTTTVDQNDPISWVKAALFGKNAIPEVKAFYENGSKALSEKQSDIFAEINKTGGDTKGFLDSVFANRGGSDNTDVPIVGSDEARAKAKVNLDDGTWKLQDGVIVNKSGEVQRQHYKDVALSSADESNETYDAFVKGFNLDPSATKKKTKGSASDTGNAMYDNLLAQDDATDDTKSKASTAVNLFSNDKKYDGVPDWVKERFYKDSGFSRDDVQYASLARVDKDTKVSQYYKPLSDTQGHDALMNELYNGRKKSIYDDYLMAQDSIITQLNKEGYISKDEAKYLKSIKLERDGKEVETKAVSGSSGRSGSKGRKGGKSKKGKFDYKLFGFSSAGSSNSKQLRDLLKKAKLK